MTTDRTPEQLLKLFPATLPRTTREEREMIAYGQGVPLGFTRHTSGVTLSEYVYLSTPSTPAQRDAHRKRATIELPLAVVSVYLGTRKSTNPLEGSDWIGHRYAVTVLSVETGESMQTSYSEGTAHAPGFADAADIVAGLLMDAGSVLPYCELHEGTTHRPEPARYVPTLGAATDWADSLGYDTDSRTARQAFRGCLKTADRLVSVLGEATLTRALEIAGTL